MVGAGGYQPPLETSPVPLVYPLHQQKIPREGDNLLFEMAPTNYINLHAIGSLDIFFDESSQAFPVEFLFPDYPV